MVEAVAIYWFAVKLILIGTAVVIFVSGLDDLFIDLCYWTRRIYRSLVIYRRHPRLREEQLQSVPEQYMAIMVPAWHEADVIAWMLENAVSTFDYQHYHIFVGTYPNDEETQQQVDMVAARYPNVHKVVCARPGPTSKADCLNNVIEYIFDLERREGIEFAAFILQDAEDVVHRLELKLFNYLVPRKDLVQIPVIPLVRGWSKFTSGHYQDEFAEYHSKDVVVREALTGSVPSAGVGTAFSRRAMLALHAERDGLIFNPKSLTEDYDISFRLRDLGMKQVFVRYPVQRTETRRGLFGIERQVNVDDYVAVKEYFPDSFRAAYRQKARWTLGISLQGWWTMGWRGGLAVKYMLFRDRKSIVTSQVSMLAYFIVLNVVGMQLVHLFDGDAWWFPQLITDDSWLWWLLVINGLLLLNRLMNRMILVGALYGPLQGLLSIPRQFWANVVNCFACSRALHQFSGFLRDGRVLAWDKTTHAFPVAPGMPAAQPAFAGATAGVATTAQAPTPTPAPAIKAQAAPAVAPKPGASPTPAAPKVETRKAPSRTETAPRIVVRQHRAPAAPPTAPDQPQISAAPASAIQRDNRISLAHNQAQKTNENRQVHANSDTDHDEALRATPDLKIVPNLAPVEIPAKGRKRAPLDILLL